MHDSPKLLRSSLTKRVEDIEGYLAQVRGKALKAQFKRLVRSMSEGDQMWEYSWSEEQGPRFCYEYGWCVVRGQEIVAHEIIHFS